MTDIEYWTFRPDNVEALNHCIEKAFADAVYSGDDNITISACNCGECTERRAFFRGKHWRDVAATGQPFHLGWGGLAITSPEAWRFYLPAYMLLSLKGDGDPGDTLDSALYSLDPGGLQGASFDQFITRTSALSVAQQRCIAAYACAAVEAGAEDDSFDSAAVYWKGRVAVTKNEQGEI